MSIGVSSRFLIDSTQDKIFKKIKSGDSGFHSIYNLDKIDENLRAIQSLYPHVNHDVNSQLRKFKIFSNS